MNRRTWRHVFSERVVGRERIRANGATAETFGERKINIRGGEEIGSGGEARNGAVTFLGGGRGAGEERGMC